MKKTQKWQILALVLFVVLGLGLGLGIPMAQQQGTEDRAASMKWFENSDHFVSIRVEWLEQIPPLPPVLALVALQSHKAIGVRVKEMEFILHFPIMGSGDDASVRDLCRAAENLKILIGFLGVTDGVHEIHVQHRAGAVFHPEEIVGETRNIVDLVDFRPPAFADKTVKK